MLPTLYDIPLHYKNPWRGLFAEKQKKLRTSYLMNLRYLWFRNENKIISFFKSYIKIQNDPIINLWKQIHGFDIRTP